jgi:hypothetical protein
VKIRRTVKDRKTVKDPQTEDRRTVEDPQTEDRRTVEDPQTEDAKTELLNYISKTVKDRKTLKGGQTEDRRTVEDRRRVERQSALWTGSCHIQEEPSDLWRECAVTDVSTLGMGIDLWHPDPVELLGMWEDGELRLHLSRRITVRLKLGASVEMTVAGEVRNAQSETDGIVRAGIEFVGLTESERSVVDLLERRAERTKPRHARGSQPVEAREAPSYV